MNTNHPSSSQALPPAAYGSHTSAIDASLAPAAPADGDDWRQRPSVDAARILMLVPHDPSEDPRIGWVASLCRDAGPTTVLGATWSTPRQKREYDGRLYVERVIIREHASSGTTRLGDMAGSLYRFPALQRYVVDEAYAQRSGPNDTHSRPAWMRRASQTVDRQAGLLLHFLWACGSYPMISDALYRSARGVSLRPRLIICHDLYALVAGVRLRKQFGCALVYDSHEFWPQAELNGQQWQYALLTQFERRLIRQADVVITVSPPLARHLRGLYKLRRVYSVPNAEPFHANVRPSASAPLGRPVRFLLQGKVGPRRGIGEFLKTWCTGVTDPRAQLWLRCPATPFVERLRTEFADAIGRGQLVIAPPVREEELIGAAAQADVGIIPYTGPNLNHLYSCPNKLSQFMHAGVAILSNRLEFVSEVIERYECGLTYDADQPASVLAAVRQLVDNPQQLQTFKENAYRAARLEFNWQVQSAPYRDVIEELLQRESMR